MKAPSNLIDLTRLVCRGHAEKLADAMNRLLRHPDEEAVHDVRVTCRRLRVVIKMIEPLYRKRMIRAARGRFRDLLRVLGPIRDAEVLGERAKALSEQTPHAGLLELARLFNAQAEFERIKAVAAVDRRNFITLPRLLEALLVSPAISAQAEEKYREKSLSKFAFRQLSEHLDNIDQYADLGADSAPEDLHELRIEFKKLRYTAEFFQPALPLKPLIKATTKFQELLGDLHDTDVALHTFTPCLRRTHSAASADPASVDTALRDLVASATEQNRSLRQAFAAKWTTENRHALRQALDEVNVINQPAPA